MQNLDSVPQEMSELCSILRFGGHFVLKKENLAPSLGVWKNPCSFAYNCINLPLPLTVESAGGLCPAQRELCGRDEGV